MQCKAIHQEANNLGLLWRGYTRDLFQKRLALKLPLRILPGVYKRTAGIIKAHSDTAALRTGMVFTLAERYPKITTS